MNAEILATLIEKVLHLDDHLSIQTYLVKARDAMSNMVSAPQEPSYQTAFVSAFNGMKSSVAEMSDELTPGDWERLAEIKSGQFFSQSLIDRIETLITENAATPAVIRDELVEITKERDIHLDKLSSTEQGLAYLGFSEPENSIDEGQVGFKLPRPMFENHLSGLISELNFLRRFIRLVSEAEGANPDDVEVGSISTTDPIFWFVVAYAVALRIGALSTWSLDTWKKVEDIRYVRAQTAQLQSFSNKEVDKIFLPKIEEQVKLAVETKVAEITAKIADENRKNELENGLRTSLRQFLARVERGMVVDVRYLPGPIPENGDVHSDADDTKAERHAEFKAVAASLIFPKPVGEPILQIEAANDAA